MGKKDGAGLPAVTGATIKYPLATVEDLEAFLFMSENALDIVKENLGGLDMSPNDFERLKFPSGGSQSWEVFGLDGEAEFVKSIDGIVLMQKTTRNYWQEAYTGEGSPPNCQSKDLISGVGNPGGLCATCPYAQWGSGKDGGQACKLVSTLFVLKPGEMLPVIVPVPVTSVGVIKKFMLGLASKSIKYSNAILGFGLVPDQNKGGIKYSKIKPRLIAVLPPEAKEQIDKFIAAFKDSMEKATVTREQLNS